MRPRLHVRRARLVALLLAFAFVPRAPLGAQEAAPRPKAAAPAVDENDMAARLAAQAATALAAGRKDEAQAAWTRVLERDPKHLRALAGLARLARDAQPPRLDEALWRADAFLWQWKRLKERPQDLAATAKELDEWARAADPQRKRLDELRRKHVSELIKIAAGQMDAQAWHGAQAVLKEARGTDPDHPELVAALARIRLEGGNELAVEDETGGADPLVGVTAEWVAQNDPLHADWGAAWELPTEHYVVRTNAGWRVLKTVAHAMEQVHVFYRRFHRYKLEKGDTVPTANVLIFKDAKEYKELGGQPVDWAAGHWDGTNVVTYDARADKDSGLSGMLDTLFHEASHQFTSLAGGSAVPAWLNEGMASFFEGTRLLSNGKLEWNLVVPGRLYPLLDELKEKKHDLPAVLEGRVSDYRSYYPWGWGIVYYLYNAEDDEGTLLYRDLLPEYFQQYDEPAHTARFVDYFVARPKVPGVADLAQFEARFTAWIRELEAVDKGLVDLARRSAERGDAQAKKGEWKRAIELYERSLKKEPGHPETLWKLAAALEADKQADRAAGTLRQWSAATLPAAGEADAQAARRAEAAARIARLDTSARRLEDLRKRFHKEALLLAQDYRKAGFPRLALQVLRGPATAVPPDAAARELYFAVSDESKVSLETWRTLFDERTLKGFYGGGEGDFRVQGGAIVATIGADADNGGGPSTGPAQAAARQSSFAFRRLFVDVEPAGDWSLSAEVDLAGARLAGLCFGKKRDDSFHGVALLPEGYVDLGAFGADGKTLLRVKKTWQGSRHTLRIETAGTRLVAFVDDEQVLDWTFDSRARLAGDFGLLAGDGQSAFRDIRMLEYDPGLPRRTQPGRRREAPAASVVDGEPAPLARAAAARPSYLDEAPPLLGACALVGEAPFGRELDALRFRPTVLWFWTTYQEAQVPCLDGVRALVERHKADEVAFLLVSNEEPAKVEAYAREHQLPCAVVCDPSNRVYDAYATAKTGLPHAKLVGVGGRVVWEGNPDWKKEYGSYLDEPLAKHLEGVRWNELRAAGPELERASAARAAGDLAAALAVWTRYAALDADHPVVARAKCGLAGLRAEARSRLARAEDLARGGRVLQAEREARRVARLCAGLDVADEAQAAQTKLAAGKAWKEASRAENKLESAEKQLAQGKAAAAAESLVAFVAKLEPKADPELGERAAALFEAAKAAEPKAELAAYRARFELD